MRENLVPELRTDKNGKSSTRWVRPAGTSTVKGAGIPVPSLSSKAKKKQREEIDELLYSAVIEFNDDHTKFYAQASDSILALIHESLTTDDDPDSTLPGQLSCLMHDNVEEHVLEAWLHLRDMHEDTIDDMGEVDYIRGAIESGTKPLNTYDRTNPEHSAAVRALFKFLYLGDSEMHGERIDIPGRTANGITASSHRVENPFLADYIVANPKDIDMLIDIGNRHPEWLNKDNFTSSTELPAIFGEYLDTTAPLQEGVL